VGDVMRPEWTRTGVAVFAYRGLVATALLLAVGLCAPFPELLVVVLPCIIAGVIWRVWCWRRRETQPGMRPSPIIPTTSSTSTTIESSPILK
jgi:hypothetical protein